MPSKGKKGGKKSGKKGGKKGGSNAETTMTTAAAAGGALAHESKDETTNNTTNNDNVVAPIPVTILSGFLGSGKTTLLKHILESNEHKLKIAVIVNDMAELNIDASLVVQQQQLVQTERQVISLQNGCICCTLRGDLIREVARIRNDSDSFDYVVIESTGIAEPQQVAQAFCFDPATAQLAESPQQMLWTQARLDTCVTVIDAHSFPVHMATLEQFGDAYTDGLDTTTPEGIKEGEKPIASLLMDQVEFANVILLNKMDLVDSPEELEEMKKVISSLNPTAKIVTTEYCKLDSWNLILNTGMFDMDKASRSPGWLQELRKIQQEEEQQQQVGNTRSEMDEYGVSSYVYRARIPFHPNRIAKWVASFLYFDAEWKALPKEQRSNPSQADPKYKYMMEHYGNILRSKGFCWLSDHDSFMIGLAQSGRIGSLLPIMPWYVILPEEQWGVPTNSDDYAIIQSKFAKPHGDRRQELVFIGTNLKSANIKADLDKCLFTKQELENYQFYSDRASLGK